MTTDDTGRRNGLDPLRRAWSAYTSTATVVLRASFRASPRLAAAVLAVAVVEAVVPVGLAWTVRELIDGVLGDAGRLVSRAVVAIGVIALVLIGSQWVAMTSQTVLEERTDHELDQELAALVHSVPDLSAVESPEFQDQVFTVSSRPRHLVGSISTITEIVALAVRFAASVALLAFVAPALAGLPLLVLFPIVASMRMERQVSDMLGDISAPMRVARLLFLASTAPGSAAELRGFGMTAAVADRQDEMLRSADRRQRTNAVRNVATMAVGWALFAVGVLVMLWLARRTGDLRSGGVVFLLVVLATQLVGQAEQAANTFSKFSRLATSLERFTWIRRFVEGAAARHTGEEQAPLSLTKGIEFRHVSFRHHPEGPLVLDDVDLVVPAGSVVALAGHNGAGKSTLVKLLLGLYRPTSGEILLDGVPLHRIDLDGLQRSASAGFQDFCRLELVAGDSVGCADLPRIGDRPAETAALRRAGSFDLVDRLKDGLDTPLGRSMPGGAVPSEGQWQKLALGRAMMREAPILRILDEPTASLDAESEAALFERYLEVGRASGAASGCITVLVSHRFATVRTADLIVTLRDGRVAEVGTHAALTAAGGWYADVCAMQAADYG